ncbi:hypothetical protein D8B26_001489 [Coccidioides posadasii str. Silveira]|uniref:Lactamase-like protein nscB n=2 Tax=Coccidioides posadasii TaxID=199306 RepID=E9CVD0_COCPS|nr:metallo-beta-lactamase superfamily protein [Coccidioides posadasii C735 delta SOWgp]EER23387.1 metallo-beta-lactamase superfamily protein [Coccidioides posadasii C735 delta SOWgp]EFW21268.1 metallo-beta-lactamase domain-containing protein [Coccidioides posadasii str. Silveira]QVM06784.1 hypothetical protein D8B26_001489 [Coccidioides posadasii str. Silveira]|eukprot:XP_003065532.1 metallo-beta-lactamase superfamily protein [Coccidioides posadasii C735 delta SOWgp]
MAVQLISIPEVERLSASVIRILAGNPGKFTLQGTNTYLVGRGPQRLLIDTGEGKPSWIAALKSVLAAERATVSQALLTHWHHDHIGGVADLSRLCPKVKIYKHQPDGGQEDIHDGQVFKVEGATLTAFYTPGHASDHMAFVLEEENAMFTADNVLGHGTAVFENLGVYLTSLEKMSARGTKTGYPGHGPIIEDCKTKIAEYIKHRQQRENEILRVLEYGSLEASPMPESSERKPSSWTPMELVKVIYQNVPENLHLPAAYGVSQVLLKLEDDGRVIHDRKSDKWTLISVRSTL